MYLGKTGTTVLDHSTETRTYLGLTGIQAFDGFMGLRIDKRYTSVAQDDGIVLVALVGAPMSTGVTVSSEEWRGGLGNKID